MVSTVPSSGTQNPPLSYADRVKKSQGISSPSASTSASPAKRSPVRSIPPNPSSVPGSISSKSVQPATSQRSAEAATEDEPPVPIELPTKDNKPNGDVKQPHADLAGGISLDSEPKITSQPAVNVWSVRKAQMARGLPRKQSNDPSLSAPEPIIRQSSDVPKPLPTKAPPSSTSSQSSAVQQSEPTLKLATTLNGSDSKARVEHDASVLSQGDGSSLLHLEDTTAWPEVGRVDAPSSSGLRRNIPAGSEREETSAEKDGTKRGEKTKWVPIPAEELQAAADAQRTSRSHSSVHSRSRSHQHTISGSPGGSTSGRDSQHRSRAQSSRQSGSQVASTSHSRTQSRSGSLQSSPRHSAVRRRLPDELSGAQQRSLRSSRAASPQPQTFNTRDPLVTGVAAPMARYGGPYTHPYPDSQSESAYYPRDFSRGHSPYDIPPGMSSPMGPPYLPHGQYPPPPLPMPPSYPVGVPPYPVYQPYTYYGQPYVFWGGSSGQHSQDISQSHSPSTYPAPLTNSHPSPRLPPPAMPPSVTHASSEPIANEQDAGGQEKSRPRVLSFGTIDVASSATPVTNKSIGSSGPVSVATTSETATAPAPSSTDAGVDSSLPVFAIGLQPGDPGPSRKRGTSSAGLSVPDIVAGSSNSSAGPDATSASTSGPALAGEAAEADALVPEVADLSVSDQKWEFGSTQEGEQASAAPTEPASDVTLSATSVNTPLDDPRVRLSPLERIVDPTGLPPTPVPTSATVLYAAHSPLSPDSRSGDEFRVKDYGYGFGRPRGTAPSFVPREDRIPRDDRVPRESVPYNARPRRGSYNGGDTYERGGYLGRRGRGRGYGRGGRGYGDYSGPRRGLPRNQYSNMAPPVPYDTTYYPVHVPGGAYVTPGYDMYGQYTAPYNAAPPPIPATSSPTQAAAPVPIPVTRLSFPIDPLRYYLLGQLEYYLSEDNLAQDLYLRQNMDSRGWIPIPLIASFRRIKSLTYDFQLVKDVLTLSSLVEVNADWVRMNRWEQYVLPDAPSSSLEPEGAGPSNYAYHVNVEESILVHPPSAEVTINQHNAAQLQDPAPMASTPEVDDDEELEDEDEDDVEFVLGADTSAPWTPDPKTEL